MWTSPIVYQCRQVRRDPRTARRVATRPYLANPVDDGGARHSSAAFWVRGDGGGRCYRNTMTWPAHADHLAVGVVLLWLVPAGVLAAAEQLRAGAVDDREKVHAECGPGTRSWCPTASKRFVIRKEKSLKERMVNFGRSQRAQGGLLGAARRRPRRSTAGSTVGLIGPNGSGQEHAAQADRRHHPAHLRARCSTGAGWPRCIELGAGFHPDLTGRENVYLNCAILGLTREQTDAVLRRRSSPSPGSSSSSTPR